jgi:hypothetical protein
MTVAAPHECCQDTHRKACRIIVHSAQHAACQERRVIAVEHLVPGERAVVRVQKFLQAADLDHDGLVLGVMPAHACAGQEGQAAVQVRHFCRRDEVLAELEQHDCGDTITC